MRDFWKEHSKDNSLEEMMLDTDAEGLCEDEFPEVLNMLPSYANKNILELGSGIGRFTTEFASKARSVVAVDFMETFISRNRQQNAKYGNIDFKVADVTQLRLQPESFELIFSNWLMMYLNNEEIQTLAKNMLDWCSEDGYVYIRESCFHQSGDKDRMTNPTFYRTPAMYNALFQSVALQATDGNGTFVFELEFSRSIQAYVKHKDSINQICWLFKKVRQEGSHHGFKTFQEFLDNKQYSTNSILRYEKIFGKHFVSTGGKEVTEDVVAMLNLKEGDNVLDVGAGIGGSAFYMAEKFNVKVLGIDLSSNMVSIGIERANEIKDSRVMFEIADATKRDFEESSFDIVYSRDTILHIKDKATLFSRFLKWLKPGGKLLISDYCSSEGEHSDDFRNYVAQRGYHLLSPVQYGQVLKDVGFINVKAEDKTDLFVEVLQRELKRTEDIKDEFIEEFTETDYNYIVDGWKEKQKRCAAGDQKWGLFYATKKNN